MGADGHSLLFFSFLSFSFDLGSGIAALAFFNGCGGWNEWAEGLFLLELTATLGYVERSYYVGELTKISGICVTLRAEDFLVRLRI